MQPIRGTKDILPNDIEIWQQIYKIAYNTLNNYNYSEIRTPILENTNLFERCIGNLTDIVNKEMYTFKDQGNRSITLRPEGTSSIARAVLSNKINLNNKMNRLWYLGPMFRYERPQKGRQRQFHQLGIECMGSEKSIADAEVIKIAYNILVQLKCDTQCHLEINSIGNIEERELYKIELTEYLEKYVNELDEDSKKRIHKNPLRILDSKNKKTQQILTEAPLLHNYLGKLSKTHFENLCKQLNYLDIKYKINNYLVRGLDYYNYTAFEIKTNETNQQNTICGGGRYDYLTHQLGGPKIPAVGWAIGIERLITLTKYQIKTKIIYNTIYIATDNLEKESIIWDVVSILETYNLRFELDFTDKNLSKKIKKASQMGIYICIIISQRELDNNSVRIHWLKTGQKQIIPISNLQEYINYIKNFFQLDSPF
uniref:Histidine--tRNA ligase, chloroplastic n=1 Tax=Polysiphonia elongata TaxID=159753 RepID=A0A1Z1MBR0_9FLOR|nr:Histidine-tRNA ligase [Polysiphonia elongata]ARW63416.1 Histidine-tRNA ligase [Polysiphonia elongata]